MNNKYRNLPRIFVRHDQRLADIGKREYQDENVIIFAPTWLKLCLAYINNLIQPGPEFCIEDNDHSCIVTKMSDPLNLKELMMMARNERANVSGRIKFNHYLPLITEPALIYSIKDLIRQTIIVGFDETTHYGGYGEKKEKQIARVILVDLIGLQFQAEYNTGRLVLIGADLPRGVLDDMIYENIVGESKKSFYNVVGDTTGRYIKQGHVYFDTFAYRMFVAKDLYLVCLAVNQFTKEPVNLKFLKYGTGFFAGGYSRLLEQYINQGVFQGLNFLFESGLNKIIKAFEFPYYQADSEIENICHKLGVKCKFSRDDALKVTDPGLRTATTDCADPHAVTGNEMGYSSVDAAIGENLKDKAFKFSPVINQLMCEKYIEVNST